MPVKKTNYIVLDVLSRKVAGGVLSYLVKLQNYTGSHVKWLPSYEVSGQAKVILFEKRYQKHNADQRVKRLQHRDLKKAMR